ncbi:hypothetical protein GCM10027452_25340 [Micromonospora halotolerans]
MARSVYLTSVGSGGGKSTVALGLAELLSRQVERIGAFRPLVSGQRPDPILALLTERYRVELPLDELHGATYAEAAALVADGQREELIARIVARYRAVERHCPAVVVVGSDFADGDGAGARELAFNARLATEFSSVVVPVVDGFGQPPEAIAAALRGAYHDLEDLGATVVAAVANRVPEPMTLPELPVPAYAIPEVPIVSAPTVAEVAAALRTAHDAGDQAALDRDVLDYVVGAAHVPTLLDHLTDGAVVINPGDRADLLVAAGAAHVAGQVSLAGLVLTLGEQPDPRAMRLVERLNTGLAVLSVTSDSYDTVAASSRIEGRPSVANPRKVEAALGAFERCVDTVDLARRLRVSRSERVTPLMFENDLIDRARAQRRRLVLPEGTEERILRAAEVLLRRGVADLTLLGRPDEVARRTRELGIDVGDARVVDPVTSEWRDEFAAVYAELRAQCRPAAPTAWSPGPPTPRRPPSGRPSRSSGPCRASPSPPACSSCCSPTACWSTATARSTPTRTPPSSPTSPSPRPTRPPGSASSPGWPCCPTRPVTPASGPTWRRSRRPRSWSGSAGRSCSWRARSSTTRRSTRRSRPPSCRTARWRGGPRCSSSRT